MEGEYLLKGPVGGDDAHYVARNSPPADSLASKKPATDPSDSPRAARLRKSDVAVILEVDEATTELLGFEPDEMVDLRSLDFIHPDDQGLAVENWMQMLASTDPARTVRLRHKHKDGSWVWVDVTNENCLDDPSLNCVVAEMVIVSDDPDCELAPDLAPEDVIVDVTPRQLRLHEAIREREELLHKLSEALPLGVLQVDARGRVVYTNQKLHAILGSGRKRTFEEQLCTVVPSDRPHLHDAFETALRGGLDNDIEVRLLTMPHQDEKDMRRCTISLRTLSSESGVVTGAIACVADITESVRMREELRVRATFDQVTQCYNRISTMESLDRMLSCSDVMHPPAVIFIDLDRFKEINDHLGHAAGDELLGIIAKRLGGSVRKGSIVGRIGGDEFLVVCPHISASAQAMRAATRIAHSLERPISLKSAQVSCHASIGVAWSAGARIDVDTLVAQADSAMYVSKRQGVARPVLYVRGQ